MGTSTLSAFGVSYCALGATVVVQMLLLQQIVRQVLRLERGLWSSIESSREEEEDEVLTGKPIPGVALRIAGTQTFVLTRRMRGVATMLVFVSPDDARGALFESLRYGLVALWHKVDGRIYLVCRGSESDCLSFSETCRSIDPRNHPVDVLMDPDGQFTRSLSITDTPSAVMLDRRGTIVRYGRPIPGGRQDNGRQG